MKARHFIAPGSSDHCGSLGSLKLMAVRIPCALARPAGLRTLPIEADEEDRNCAGFHPSSATTLIAWAANFAVAKFRKISGLVDLI